jgi:hypothetical protein
VILLPGATVSIELIRFLASGVTVSHSGDGYCWWRKKRMSIYQSDYPARLHSHHKLQLWFGHTIDVDLHPKREDIRPTGCTESHLQIRGDNLVNW